MGSRSAALPTTSTRLSASILCRPARISGEAATIKTRITQRLHPFRRSNLPAAPSRDGLASNRHEEICNEAGASLDHRSPSQGLQPMQTFALHLLQTCLQPSVRLARPDCHARLQTRPTLALR